MLLAFGWTFVTHLESSGCCLDDEFTPGSQLRSEVRLSIVIALNR